MQNFGFYNLFSGFLLLNNKAEVLTWQNPSFTDPLDRMCVLRLCRIPFSGSHGDRGYVRMSFDSMYPL